MQIEQPRYLYNYLAIDNLERVGVDKPEQNEINRVERAISAICKKILAERQVKSD